MRNSQPKVWKTIMKISIVDSQTANHINQKLTRWGKRLQTATKSVIWSTFSSSLIPVLGSTHRAKVVLNLLCSALWPRATFVMIAVLGAVKSMDVSPGIAQALQDHLYDQKMRHQWKHCMKSHHSPSYPSDSKTAMVKTKKDYIVSWNEWEDRKNGGRDKGQLYGHWTAMAI